MSNTLVYLEDHTVTIAASGADIASGEMVDYGDLVAIAKGDIADGSTGAAWIKGIHTYAKLNTEAWTAGQVVYLDEGNSRLTTTASTHNRAGVAHM
jgi:predicted RecA/RadA family phage recombinase